MNNLFDQPKLGMRTSLLTVIGSYINFHFCFEVFCYHLSLFRINTSEEAPKENVNSQYQMQRTQKSPEESSVNVNVSNIQSGSKALPVSWKIIVLNTVVPDFLAAGLIFF